MKLLRRGERCNLMNDINGKCESLTCKLACSQPSDVAIWIACWKNNSFVEPTTFGAGCRLPLTLWSNLYFHTVNHDALPMCPVPCRPSFAPPKKIKQHSFSNGPSYVTSPKSFHVISIFCSSSDSVSTKDCVGFWVPKVDSDFRNTASFRNYSAWDVKRRPNFALFDARKIYGSVGESVSHFIYEFSLGPNLVYTFGVASLWCLADLVCVW